MERQKEFRAAAVEAKRAGEMDTAKEYLKIYKGLENLLHVAQGGLPVDLNTVCQSPKSQPIFGKYKRICFSFQLRRHNDQIWRTHLQS